MLDAVIHIGTAPPQRFAYGRLLYRCRLGAGAGRDADPSVFRHTELGGTLGGDRGGDRPALRDVAVLVLRADSPGPEAGEPDHCGGIARPAEIAQAGSLDHRRAGAGGGAPVVRPARP